MLLQSHIVAVKREQSVFIHVLEMCTQLYLWFCHSRWLVGIGQEKLPWAGRVAGSAWKATWSAAVTAGMEMWLLGLALGLSSSSSTASNISVVSSGILTPSIIKVVGFLSCIYISQICHSSPLADFTAWTM